MKLLRRTHTHFEFDLPQPEKQVLLALLQQYPLIPAERQRLSKSVAVDPDDANQRLLDEALAEHRLENQNRLKTLLLDGKHFKQTRSKWRLVLDGSEIDWLLQMLNDVRVGCWIRLGAPEDDLWNLKVTEENAPHAWTMELAGMFEAALLDALHNNRSL